MRHAAHFVERKPTLAPKANCFRVVTVTQPHCPAKYEVPV
jgi:hypothetical protein